MFCWDLDLLPMACKTNYFDGGGHCLGELVQSLIHLRESMCQVSTRTVTLVVLSRKSTSTPYAPMHPCMQLPVFTHCVPHAPLYAPHIPLFAPIPHYALSVTHMPPCTPYAQLCTTYVNGSILNITTLGPSIKGSCT